MSITEEQELSKGEIVQPLTPLWKLKRQQHSLNRFISCYPDTGCRLHPRCLECPRPQCIYDQYHQDVGAGLDPPQKGEKYAN